jgi:serine/threonine protein kinase/CHASE1-domain containing sensor protein
MAAGSSQRTSHGAPRVAEGSGPPSLRGSGFRLHRESAAAFVLGMTATILAFQVVRREAADEARVIFERRAADVATSVRSHLERPLEVLESVCSLFAASPAVGRTEFRRFVQSALARHPGIRALEWIPRVESSARPALEARARQEGLLDFALKELNDAGQMVRAAERPVHLPIYFMEPPDALALGFDLGADPERAAPLERAFSQRTTVASERIRLVEDRPEIASIAVFCPVFGDAAGDRDALPLGAGAAVFRLRDIVAPAIAAAVPQGIDVGILDRAAAPAHRLLFESSLAHFTDKGALATPNLTLQMPFADRTWSLVFACGEAYPFHRRESAWFILLSGFALSSMLAVGLSSTRIIFQLRRRVRVAEHLGQYTLVRKLGEGGMGIVWEARHALLRRPTAIKLLPLARAGAQAIARFEREVQLTSRLTHPNTVAIYDYGHTSDGVFYYAMEYLDGDDLQAIVERDGAQPPARVVHILVQVLGALAEAHAAGLVHRDIKPANIVLCMRGGLHDVAKVVDFGLVKDAADLQTSVREAQNILGTPQFLSPEAIRTPGLVDARSDLYALGAVAYYLLTGSAPFQGETALSLCEQQLFATPESPSQRIGQTLPPALEAAVLRCLSKRPEERFNDADALRKALQDCALPAWTEEDARAASERMKARSPVISATDRTLPADSPSMLEIELRRPLTKSGDGA